MAREWPFPREGMEIFKDIFFKGIKRYVTQKILSKNWQLHYYNKEENG